MSYLTPGMQSGSTYGFRQLPNQQQGFTNPVAPQPRPGQQQGFTNPVAPQPVGGGGATQLSPQQLQQLQQMLGGQGQTQSNPMQPFYLGAPTMANPTFYGGTPDPTQAFQQAMTAFQPQAQSANAALQAQLAAAGLGGSGAAIGAQDQLQGQLAAGLAPTLGNILQNVWGLQQQSGLYNTGAQNQFTLENLQNLLNAQGYNVGAANTAQNQLAQALMQQWQQQYGAFSGLNQQGLGGGVGIAQQAQQNFPVYGGLGNAFSNLGQALGGAYNPYGGSSTPPYQPIPGSNPYSWLQ